MRSPLALGPRCILAFAGALGLAACENGAPTALGEVVVPTAETDVAIPFTCMGSTVSWTVRCDPDRDPDGGPGGPASVVLGSQGTHLQVSSSNVSYNAGTEIFQFDVTVQNLLNEAIGTPDGVTPDADGIRVFIKRVIATGGSGTITAANEDGTATFTASNQEYFQYSEVLDKDEVSSAKTWDLAVPTTVSTFAIKVLVATSVQPLLVINEVLANPGGTISDLNGEWFELYNAGTLDVDLQNMVIADSAASGRRPYHLIGSSLVVPPGGYMVLGGTTNTTDNGGVTVDYAYGSALALANSLDAVKIARVWGSDTLTIDRTQYASAAISAQNGISRELKNPALDNSNMDGSNWADALVTAVYGPGGRGTPKAQNSAYTP
jgi:hypothetical protein